MQTASGRQLVLFCLALTALIGGPLADLFAAEKAPAEIPLKSVVLYSSGVGFFDHVGQVNGRVQVEMKFKVDEINDLLKSLIVQDLGGGSVSAVTYGSRDPVGKTLKTFAIDLTRSPSLADLLRQIRGEKIQVEIANATVSGSIVGVERRPQRVGKEEIIEADVLVLRTATGLRSVPMESIVEVRLLDEKLNSDLQQALDTLARERGTDKKPVCLDFRGVGQRKVRVGYIQETPVWKTSYRLVLKDDEKPFLQGWAIVENTSEQDWDDVSLTLVSGRPISFIMDLYEPLYVGRPLVVPEHFLSLQPRTHGQNLGDPEAEMRKLFAGQSGAARRKLQSAGQMGGGGGFGGGGMGGGGMAAAMGGGPVQADFAPLIGLIDKTVAPDIDLKQGVASAAKAEEVGELFRYVIKAPVKLARQKSAMLPIVNDTVKGEKLSIYNPAVHAKHPLNGFKLVNSTDLHLMQGPITVFDGDAYAGDARIEDVAPKAERLISYALDLDTEVAPQPQPEQHETITAKIAKGVLSLSHRQSRTQRFVVKNSGTKPKKVLIEMPIDAAWKLSEPKLPAETTRDVYRFAVAAPAGQSATLNVMQERIVEETVELIPIAESKLVAFMQSSSKAITPQVKAAFAEILKRRQAVQEINERRVGLIAKVVVIEQEQTRIRQNMEALDRTSELYQRYVKKLTEQETQIEKLRSEIEQAEDEWSRRKSELNDYVSGLNV